MPLQGSFAYPLGVPPNGISSDQVLDLIIQVLPIGSARLYGLSRKAGDPFNFYAAIADSLKAFWYDGIAILRAEINPATTAYKLREWEAALGLSQTPIALSGNTVLRRLQIVAKLREQGPPTFSNIQGIIGPLLGYANSSQLQIIEANRAALTAAHTYSNATGASIGANGLATQLVYVSDDGGVCSAGAQLKVAITCTNPEQLSFTLTGPSNGAGTGVASVTFPAASLPAGAVTATTFQLNDLTCVGKKIFGNWTLTVNAGAAGCTLVSWSLFVEGGGQRDAMGGSGLGTELSYWVVFADPALVNSPQIVATLSALQRIRPAHTTVDLASNTTAKPSTTQFPPFIVMST